MHPEVQDREDRALQEKKRRIAQAAKAVFLKYGYRRVTMSDLASAAGMSRPALYLVFSKKEDVFGAVVRELAHDISDEVKAGIASLRSPLEKLKLACEIWMVRSFDQVQQSEEVREVYEGGHEFAREAVAEAMALFENDLATVIELLPKGALPKSIAPRQAAHLLVASIAGVKQTCRNSAELRDKIHALIALVVRT